MKIRLIPLRCPAANNSNGGLTARKINQYSNGRRQYVTNESKAPFFHPRELEGLEDRYLHFYAINRYQKLTRRAALVAGDPGRKSLSKSERKQDDESRLTITLELGHEHIQIVANYIGT